MFCLSETIYSGMCLLDLAQISAIWSTAHVSTTLKGRQRQGLEFMFLHPFQSNRKKKWRKWIALGLCLSLLKEAGKTLAPLLQFSPRPEPCSVHCTSFLRLMMCAPLIESNRLSLHEEFCRLYNVISLPHLVTTLLFRGKWVERQSRTPFMHTSLVWIPK